MKLLIITLFLIMFSTPVYALQTPYIDGQDTFNTTVEQMEKGNFSLRPDKLINEMINLFLSQIRENSHLLVLFFIIGTVSSIVTLTEFSNKASSEATFFACYTLCAGIALRVFTNIADYSREIIFSMTDFITKLAPILSGLLIVSGKAVSAGAFHPVLSSAVFIVSLIVKHCIIPLAIYSAILNVANNLNPEIRISGFCRLITSCAKWILTAVFTVFTGICGIYGFAAPALDVVGSKTAKFAIGSLVPVVGRFLSDTLDTVVSAGTLMKNAVGGAGIFTLFTICLLPIIKIAVMLFFLKICSALIEPLTDNRISKLLSDISESVSVIFGMVLTTAVLFMITLAIIVASTN